MAEGEQTQAQPWYTGLEAADVGHLQNRGWDKLPAHEAAQAAFKSFRAAESRLGMPADEIVRFPTNHADPAMADIWKRLGKPETADGYDLSPLGSAEKPLDPTLAASLRDAAHKANMTPGQALEFANAFLSHQAAGASKTAAEAATLAAAEKDRLTGNWGPRFETNKFIAGRGAQSLGITPEELGALEGSVGYSRVMEAMLKVGMAQGEARYITGGDAQGKPGVMSYEQATAKRGELLKDTAWRAKWAAGGAEEARELNQIMRVIAEHNVASR